MITTALSLLLSAAPSLYKLFTSDDKTTAAKDLTKNVVASAAKEFGIKLDNEDDLLNHISNNPETVVKLKELENEYALKIEELKLENKKVEYSNEQQKEENISNRWESDNKSDSRFAKLIRPALTAYLIFIVTILSILDGNYGTFAIKEVWVNLFVSLCITTVSGYFVLRTYEKRTGTSVWKK